MIFEAYIVADVLSNGDEPSGLEGWARAETLGCRVLTNLVTGYRISGGFSGDTPNISRIWYLRYDR